MRHLNDRLIIVVSVAASLLLLALVYLFYPQPQPVLPEMPYVPTATI